MKKRLGKRDYEILAALRYALRKFLRFSEDAAQRAGLNPQQHQALLAIKGFPGRDYVTVGELAERLQIRHHSAVGLADRLVSEKHITRTRNPRDQRQVYLKLTSRGERVLADLTTAHQEQLRHLGPKIDLLLKQVSEVPEKKRHDIPKRGSKASRAIAAVIRGFTP